MNKEATALLELAGQVFAHDMLLREIYTSQIAGMSEADGLAFMKRWIDKLVAALHATKAPLDQVTDAMVKATERALRQFGESMDLRVQAIHNPSALAVNVRDADARRMARAVGEHWKTNARDRPVN